MPVLIVEQIKKEVKASKAQKLFVINTTNKPFETNGFKVSDYISALNDHVGEGVFDKILVNSNYSPVIPKAYKYKYVDYDSDKLVSYQNKVVDGDLVDEIFPLYHDSTKLAKMINKLAS